MYIESQYINGSSVNTSLHAVAEYESCQIVNRQTAFDIITGIVMFYNILVLNCTLSSVRCSGKVKNIRISDDELWP